MELLAQTRPMMCVDERELFLSLGVAGRTGTGRCALYLSLGLASFLICYPELNGGERHRGCSRQRGGDRKGEREMEGNQRERRRGRQSTLQ